MVTMKSKNTQIYVTMENVLEVASTLKKMIGKEKEDELKFETWYKEQESFLEKEANNSQRLRALGYIEWNKEIMFRLPNTQPYYVCFGAHIHVESVLEYGSELIQSANFGASYDAAFRKMQQVFKNCGFEFSHLRFSWTDDDHLILFWETKYPILFTDILDYPKSLMAFATLLDKIGIDGLKFNYPFQLLRDVNEIIRYYEEGMYRLPKYFKDDYYSHNSNIFKGEAFKKEYIIAYGDNDYHLTQNLIDDFGGFIIYSLDGSYQILLDGDSDENTIESVLESGYHLVGDDLEFGLNGVINSVEFINANEFVYSSEPIDFYSILN